MIAIILYIKNFPVDFYCPRCSRKCV